MQLIDVSHTGPARSERTGVDDLLAAEHELLDRTRAVAQRITERVRQTGRLVRCDVCGRTDTCTPDELLRFTRQGWPKCCGAVMTFYTVAERPDPNDTKLNTPSLPPTPG